MKEAGEKNWVTDTGVHCRSTQTASATVSFPIDPLKILRSPFPYRKPLFFTGIFFGLRLTFEKTGNILDRINKTKESIVRGVGRGKKVQSHRRDIRTAKPLIKSREGKSFAVTERTNTRANFVYF